MLVRQRHTEQTQMGRMRIILIRLAYDLYETKMGKRFDLMRRWVLLKDQPKYETFCNQSVEASFKHSRINEMGAYSNNSNLGMLATSDSKDTPPEEGGGLIQPIGRKCAKRKAKKKVEDSTLDLVTKELLVLGTMNIEKNDIFERYIKMQERKATIAEQAIQLRDQHQAFKERKQCLKERKYEDKILRVNLTELCAED